MVEFSSSLLENEIHELASPYNDNSKNITFLLGRPNFGGDTAGNLGKMRNNRDIYLLFKSGGGQF